ACDYSKEALKIVRDNTFNVDVVEMDFTKPFEFENESLGLIIADLCLHYFSEEVTFNIISELRRVLRKDCHIILRVNSINDINFGAKDGEEIEKHFYLTKNGYKRFFDEDDIRYFFKDFDFEYLEEDSMDRYGNTKKAFVVLLRK
ncbi:MAG: class I SAM-dependent methyltransferase, partial [Clostridium sp.]